jgi:hypothetical protein
MQPTSRAIAMVPVVRGALRALEAAVELPQLGPLQSTKQFALAANDLARMVMAARLLSILRQEVPSIDLIIKPVTRIDLAEQRDLGRINARAFSSRVNHLTRFRCCFRRALEGALSEGRKIAAEDE